MSHVAIIYAKHSTLMMRKKSPMCKKSIGDCIVFYFIFLVSRKRFHDCEIFVIIESRLDFNCSIV